MMHYIFRPNIDQVVPQLGGKGKALAALANQDVTIPPWFGILPNAFFDSLTEIQQNQWAQATTSDEMLAIINAVDLAISVRDELAQALADFTIENIWLAVRSSAIDEDGEAYAFAGQLDSFLGVHPEQITEKIIAVWRSGFSEHVITYRQTHQLTMPPPIPAVLVQQLIQPEVSGVAFSADPITGQRDVAIVSAVFGLGTTLVSGESDADTYQVDENGNILQQTIVQKKAGHFFSQNGRGTIQSITLSDEQADQATLTLEQAQNIAALARQMEQIFETPQDIEWAIADNLVYLLQSRPITALPEPPSNTGQLNIWDNSNIIESYPGVTTPLTFSFARRAYEEVYHQFCRLMGVPKPSIEANHNTFRRMLGLIQGRIYYNLLSWYRVLALLPGYTLNRRFMEQMMGVKEGLPDELLDEQKTPTTGAKWLDALQLIRSLLGLITNYRRLPQQIDAFYDRLNQALGDDRPDLVTWRPDELAAYYRNLEGQLLMRWDAPLVNDFFAMIFYGLLRKMCEAWLGDKNGTLQNTLVMSTGGIISTEPIMKMQQMADLIANDADFIDLLCSADWPRIQQALTDHSEFEQHFLAYLDKFGDRCLEELKLESTTLFDDPLPLLRGVGHLARREPQSNTAPTAELQQTELEAQQQVKQGLTGRPLRRFLFDWVLNNTRRLTRNRENLRFERTRLFGRARQIFLAFGHQFHQQAILADPNDIFYLEVEEILGFVDGTTTTSNLSTLASLRRIEFEQFQLAPPPPRRFETRGVVNKIQNFQPQGSTSALDEKQRKGQGCSPGIVRGPVRIVVDPRTTKLEPGEILVATQTDPGWVMLFPAASGLLIEYGSLLSHSAIVAREMGLPAIVSLTGVTEWLKDGDWIELDGTRGTVRKMTP